MTPCQWIDIDTDPSADDACKCGKPAVTTYPAPYCGSHLVMAYLPRRELEKDRPAPRFGMRTDYR